MKNHTFYTLNDFTKEEKDRKNIIFIAVKEGMKICKCCGANNESEYFDKPCGQQTVDRRRKT